MNPATYRAEINHAIAPFGVRVFACARNGGYSYFKDREGNQVGDSVMVYRQTDLTVAQWVEQAKMAADAEKATREYWGAFKP